MSNPPIIYPGTNAKLRAEFKDLASADFDPSTVRLRVKAPNGTVTTKVYGTDVEVVREAAGIFYMWFLLDQSGSYYFRGEGVGTGVNEVAAEKKIVVRASAF